MTLDPRGWGRVPQAALVLLLLVRLPALASLDTAGGLVGGLFGMLLGAVVVVGLVRWLVVTIRPSSGDEDATAA